MVSVFILFYWQLSPLNYDNLSLLLTRIFCAGLSQSGPNKTEWKISDGKGLYHYASIASGKKGQV
jgi:hypothetical protein